MKNIRSDSSLVAYLKMSLPPPPCLQLTPVSSVQWQIQYTYKLTNTIHLETDKYYTHPNTMQYNYCLTISHYLTPSPSLQLTPLSTDNSQFARHANVAHLCWLCILHACHPCCLPPMKSINLIYRLVDYSEIKKLANVCSRDMRAFNCEGNLLIGAKWLTN